MLVMMKRAEFDAFDDAALGWACIEPTIHRIRGKGLSVKSQVYAELTPGQRALLMFWVLYGHARGGVARLFGEIAYLLARADVWSELKAGMRYFGDDPTLQFVREAEGVYRVLAARNPLGGEEGLGAHPEDLEGDPELGTTVTRLDAVFPEIAHATLGRIGSYIRANPSEFVLIEG